MGARMILSGGIPAGGAVLRLGMVIGVIFAISGMVSVGAVAINDAKRGTCTQLKARVCRAVFSAVTLSAVSKPVIFGLGRLRNKLFHREKETWKSFFRNYDPATVLCYGIARIPNRCMVRIVKLCTVGKVSAQRILENAVVNSETLRNADFFAAGEYIENQDCWKKVRFGLSTMSYSGCEIMAVYNALQALGEEMAVQDMVELISAFERKGAVLRGKWGCSSCAVYDYFLQRGYETFFICSRDMSPIDAIGRECETVIITARNNRYDIRNMIHTISVTKDKNGYYILHNAYKKDNKGEYAAYGESARLESLREVIKLMSSNGQASPICVIGINNNREQEILC